MKKRLACPILALVLSSPALADTGYYLVSTYDVEGQASIDYKYWHAQYNARTTASPEIGVGYGVTSRWYTEVYEQWFTRNGSGTRRVSTAWQNDYMLTQGQYAFDLAMHTKLERSHDREDGYMLEWGPVLQTEIGRTQFNANLFFQRDYRVAPGNGEHPMELTYQLQVKHNWKPWLQPGLQAFGEVGKWNDWLPYGQQSHRAGPMIYGHRDIGRQEVKYEFAYLIGKNSARAAKSFSMRVQYIF
jgi:hypothetical protein